MEIGPKTKLDDLLRLHPFLLEALVGLNPKFGKLRNPILRRTVGKLATLGQVAGLGDMPVEDLLKAVSEAIRARTGESAPIEAACPAEAAPLVDKAARREVLKGIIRDLHGGEDAEVLKKRLAGLIRDVGASEIAAMEEALIAEGMPAEEVKRLCDVHVKVFEDSLGGQAPAAAPPGHPVNTLMEENRALESVIAALEERLLELEAAEGFPPGHKARWGAELASAGQVETHYLRKENQLFPLLEAKGVGGPSQVMWAIHDDIRVHLRELGKAVESGRRDDALELGRLLAGELRDMITKEEKILFPMSLETLDESDWSRVRRGEEEIGYAWGIAPGAEWSPQPPAAEDLRRPAYGRAAGRLQLDTGTLTPELVNLVLKSLPVDLSLVDADDKVVYYSDTAERVFPRSPAVIGRKVQNCHPPDSVHAVERILQAFKSGARDSAEFWIESRGRFLHIRYFALRDAHGEYKGSLEVSQDVTGIRKLQGQKRLLDWD